MTLELLETFSSADEMRRSINGPWTRDGFTYATDGRIVVRVPAMPDVPDRDNAPNASGLTWSLIEHAELEPLPAFPKPAFMLCADCNALGGFDSNGAPSDGRAIICEECDGKGKWPKAEAVQIGTHKIDAHLLNKIAALPNPRIAMNGYEFGACPFVFDGGVGLVMPMRLP